MIREGYYDAIRRSRCAPSGRGFTLIELLLTVVLILLLTAAAVFNLEPLQRGARLDEGVPQFETLLRFARAEAASRGRVVRFSLEEAALALVGSTNGVGRLQWEPDPLGAPGVFVDLPQAQPYLGPLGDLIRVLEVRHLGATSTAVGTTNATSVFESATNAIPVLAGDERMDESSPSHRPWAVAFYPDGSSDSAEFILGSQTVEDPRRMSVRLTGLTGMSQVRPVTEESEWGEAKVQEPSTNADVSNRTLP